MPFTDSVSNIALGRKNYLFAGSHAAARRAAALYSFMRTCAQHDVPPLPYLTDVLRKLVDPWPKHRLDELLHDRWQQLHSGLSVVNAVIHSPDFRINTRW